MNTTAKKKVCIILRSHYSAVMGGAQYQAKIIVEQLLALGGYEVYYLAAVVDPEYNNPAYSVVALEQPQTALSKKSTLADRGSLMKRLEEIQPDVVYQNALTAHTAFAAEYARKKDIPFIFHIASDFDVLPGKVFATTWKRKMVEFCEKWIASRVLSTNCRIVAQTERQSALLEQHFGRKADLIMANLLPHPETVAPKSTEELTVIWVANLKPVKRPELFLKLAQDLAHLKHVRFVMIGRKSPDPEYVGLYDQLDQQENLEYLGPQSQDEVNDCLERSHLLVNTSDTEGYSNTYVQAWMREVPVVALNADVDGVLARRELGALSGSSEQLAKDVEALLTDVDKLRELGSAARAYSLEHNTLANIEKLAALM